MELPDKVTKTMYVLASVKGSYFGGISVLDFDGSKYSDDRVLISTFEITVDLPKDLNLNDLVVQNLEAKKDKLNADHYVAVKQIEDQIAELKSLDYKQN